MDSQFKERLEAIVTNLDMFGVGDIPEAKQRTAARYPFKAMCQTRYVEIRNGKVSFCNPTQPIHGLSRNLSRGGMSILTRKLFTQGDVIETEVLLNNNKIVYFLGLSMFSRFCGDNIFETGMRFYDYKQAPILIGNQHNIEIRVRRMIKFLEEQSKASAIIAA